MKCYNATIYGNVQDISFRSVVEHAGRLHSLSGFVFNAKDGSVKVICRGEEDVITKFFKEIEAEGERRGARITGIRKKEISVSIDLPDEFSKIITDEDVDIGRKLDKGIEILKDIKADTSAIKVGIDTLNQKFDAFTAAQGEHNRILEKILEKLTEARQ